VAARASSGAKVSKEIRLSACGLEFSVVEDESGEFPFFPAEGVRPLTGWLRDCEVRIATAGDDRSWHVDLGEFGAYSVDPERATLNRWPSDSRYADELLYGPILLGLLAQHGIFALHASAFRIDGRTVVCVAASGTGKSTLAARADRLCDDIAPIGADDAIQLLPHFPQLKIASQLQYPASAPRSCAIDALIVCNRGHTPSLRPMSATDAFLACLGNTVGARLFAPASLARHLRWAQRMAAAVDDGRLRALTMTIATRDCPQAGADETLHELSRCLAR
jgi:hypothetical protein